MEVTVWHGLQPDFDKLVAATARNCACIEGEVTCSAHQLLTDQESLNRFAFTAQIRERLEAEEFSGMPGTADG